MLPDADKFQSLFDPYTLFQGFEPDGKHYVLAARVQGPIQSAFPDGAPKDDAASKEKQDDKADESKDDTAEDGKDNTEEDEKEGEEKPTLNPEQVAEIENFQREKLKIRKQLCEVQHQLGTDIEKLGTQLKLINIALITVLLTIVALVFRARRRVAAGT